MEIMLLTQGIMQTVPTHAIQREYQADQLAACHWFQFCKEVVLDLIEGKSEITGGDDKVVKIDKRKWSEFLATDTEVPGSIPGTARFF